MNEVKITSMTLLNKPANSSGITELAYFDFEDGTYSFRGCALLRFDGGHGAKVSLPQVYKVPDVVRLIRFVDMDLMQRVREMAERKFMDMGGDPGLILDDRRGHDADGWPTHPDHPANRGPSRMDKRLADGVRAIEPVDPWAHERDNHPLINVPPKRPDGQGICLPPPIRQNTGQGDK